MSTVSARLDDDPPTRPTEIDPRRAVLHEADGVEDFDDDAPTTLMDAHQLGMPAPSGRAVSLTGGKAEQPPPLPDSYSGKVPSHRRAQLDHVQMPDTRQLESGATIVPPDDFADISDYIDDDEADETMLMARMPLPPKK